MKRWKLAVLLALLLVLLAGCSGDGAAPKTLEADADQLLSRVKVMRMYEGYALVVGWDESGYPQDPCFMGLPNEELLDGDGKAIAASDLRPGMVLDIVWNGSVAESWPGETGADKAQVAEQGDDLVGLYRQVIADLWTEDPGLNSGIELVGLDFSTLTNLTEGERSALVYLVSCDLELVMNDITYVTGTWQELCDQGYIDQENLYWENGVFLSIELTEAGEDGFVFTAEKWRSGLGAIWFTDCAAVRGSGGQWSYQPGGFSIA